MTDPRASQPFVLDRVPADALAATVAELRDVHRECQLVLIGAEQGSAADPEVVELASALLADLDEVGDLYDATATTELPGGLLRLEGRLAPGQAATLTHLQVQLLQLRLVARRGGLLLTFDPSVAAMVAWICEEVADQVHGRPPRAYRPVG